MSTILDMSLSSALLTPELMDMIEAKDPEFSSGKTEHRMVAIATLLTNIMDRACGALQKKQIRLFDANPGDGGCQLRAIYLHHLLKNPSAELFKEAHALRALVQPLKQALNRRNGRQVGSTQSFFHQHFDGITLSTEMAFLFKMFLLTATKVKFRVEENGIIVTKTDIARLDMLSKNIHQIDHGLARDRFLAKNAVDLSQESTRFIQEVAGKLDEPNPKTCQVLSEIHASHPTGDERFVPKLHSCLFFQMEVILQDLKERGATIAVKTVEKQGSPTHFFFKAYHEGFLPISPEGLEEEEPLVVFEGVVENKEEFLTNVSKMGFEKMILTLASKTPPFCSRSSLDDVTDEVARAKIKSFQDHDASFFLLDHVFCEVLKNEVRKK